MQRVKFVGPAPTLAAIEDIFCARTGLAIKLMPHPSAPNYRVRCKTLRSQTELHLGEEPVSLENPIGAPTYILDELRESLIELGGVRCDLSGAPRANGDIPLPRLAWKKRCWKLRFLDRWPTVHALLWTIGQLAYAIRSRE